MKDLDNSPLARFAVRIIVYSLLGWFFLEFNPFGIGDKTDQATQDALYKIAAPFYRSEAQKDIVIVLINQSSIRELYQRQVIQANEWPIRYRDHAYLLSRILKHRPRSLFVDIYFKEERSTDDSFSQFSRQIGRLSKKYQRPILFAGGYHHEQLTEIQESLNQLGELVVSGWQDYDQAYPLVDHGRPSTAFRLYELACLDDVPLDSCQPPLLVPDAVESGDAVSVRWGSRPGPVVFPEFSESVCTDRSGTLWEVVRQFIFGFIQDLVNYDALTEPVNAQCAYHPVIYADELVYVEKSGTDEQKQHLAAALHDKVVMYALSLEGLHDNIYSPVHGLLPGVFFHAMALDNLMHFGADYVRASDDRSAAINQGIWIVMTLLFSGVLLRFELKGIRFSDASHRPDDNVKPESRLSVLWLSAIATFVIFALSLSMFLWMRYEPMNSIGFLVLIGVSSWLVHSDFAGKVLRVLSLPWRYDEKDIRVEVNAIIPCIDTPDPELAETFYKDLLGLDLVLDCDWKKTYSSDSDMNVRVSFASEGGSGAPVPDLSIEVDDFDTALRRVKAANIKIEYGPEGEECDVRRFYVQDPFGKLVNVFQYKK